MSIEGDVLRLETKRFFRESKTLLARWGYSGDELKKKQKELAAWINDIYGMELKVRK
jgi:hypothetical protein